MKYNSRLLTTTFAILFLFVQFAFGGQPNSVFAAVSDVTATVPDQSFNAPVLVSPTNNATLTTTRPTFSWLRPSPTPASPLNHYDLYIDGAIFAASVPDSLTYADFYFYTATASGGTFYVTLKADLLQGYHTWNVTAYTDAGTSANSETRNFYVDSIAPYISVTKVDQTNLSWNTSVSGSIPSVENRYLTSTVTNPVFTGGVENSANFKIVLVCPLNIPTCTNQTYSANIPSGSWTYQFVGLLSGQTYTAKATATDASGNTTTFPDFFVTYTSPSATPTATATPTAKTTPTATPTPTTVATISGTVTPTAFPSLPLPSGALTPPPGLLNVITPTPFNFGPPAAPTPPPKRFTPRFSAVDLFYNFLIILIILGLPLHLLMATLGTGTPLHLVFKFLLILAFPFLRKKGYQTTPFTFVTIFHSEKLNRPWQTVVSDIRGFYNLKSSLPESIYIKLTAIGRIWRDTLFRGSKLPITCLYSLPMKPLDARSRFRKVLYDQRIIPLIVACLTSITAFIMRPSYFVLVYAYFSLQYLFSEYYYPKLQKSEEK